MCHFLTLLFLIVAKIRFVDKDQYERCIGLHSGTKVTVVEGISTLVKLSTPGIFYVVHSNRLKCMMGARLQIHVLPDFLRASSEWPTKSHKLFKSYFGPPYPSPSIIKWKSKLSTNLLIVQKHVGEKLHFIWDSIAENHNVLNVTKEEYETCSFNANYNSIDKSPAILELNHVGTFYIVSTIGKDCKIKDYRLIVVVVNEIDVKQPQSGVMNIIRNVSNNLLANMKKDIPVKKIINP